MIACKSLEDRLRELKRQVLRDLYQLKGEVHELSRRSFDKKPSVRELWRRRDEGARKLLEDVRARVLGRVEEEDARAIEVRSEINREIDSRLAELAELECQLAAAAGENVVAISEPPRLPKSPSPDSVDDDLYAKVGAAVQQGDVSGAHCPHCGQGLEGEDRYCRRCGHRLS